MKKNSLSKFKKSKIGGWKKSLIIFVLLTFPFFARALIEARNLPVPGGVAVIDFQTDHPDPRAFYGDAPLLVQQKKSGRWQALVGIPLLSEPGEHQIVIDDFARKNYPFEVLPHAYETQKITLPADKTHFINPDKKRLQRILKERPILADARRTFSAEILADGTFIRPVPGVVTGTFGLRRFYNNEPRSPHTGIDYAGDETTEVRAAAAGSVVLTGDFYFNGKTVFINHGRGLVSVYIHLSDIFVKVGDKVAKSQPIGRVGQTGRATGAHLHFGVYLNRTAVNPELLLANP